MISCFYNSQEQQLQKLIHEKNVCRVVAVAVVVVALEWHVHFVTTMGREGKRDGRGDFFLCTYLFFFYTKDEKETVFQLVP